MYVEELTKIDMKISRTLSISEARKNIFKIADEIQKPDICYMLTENGKAKAVIMSASEYESWMETMEVMMEMPDLKKEIDEFEDDLRTGRVKNYTTLEEFLAKEGVSISDLKEKKDDVSG